MWLTLLGSTAPQTRAASTVLNSELGHLSLAGPLCSAWGLAPCTAVGAKSWGNGGAYCLALPSVEDSVSQMPTMVSPIPVFFLQGDFNIPPTNCPRFLPGTWVGLVTTLANGVEPT